MTYKTILVHLHDKDRAHRLLEAAVPLARASDAHLIGLAVLPPFVTIPAGDGAGVSITIDEHRHAYQRDMQTLKQTFETVTKGQTFAAEWREDDAQFGTVPGIVIEQARAADLIVASQKSPEWAHSNLMEAPERLGLESGRPVLLIPNKGDFHLPPKRVTIAWNGRREAARAVFDALPLLRRADAVSVLSVNPDNALFSGDLPGAEICATLARHGVKCEATQAGAIEPDVGVEIQRLAKAFGSDLLVMGCYGHSRLREFILGGASRDVLTQMTMPVLMSH
jgi:nucleotide-binding universal stress UspA family protein